MTFTLTDVGVEFIHRNKHRPFFLYLVHWDVHAPLVAREDLVAKYEKKLASWTKNKNPYNPTYAAMVEAVDTGVGRILETLDELNLSERTLVIFSSDNGGTRVSINRPLRGVKGSLYEGGVRVPTCMGWRGVIKPGSKSATPITSVDFLPTFADLAGVALATSQPVDGESLIPLLKGTRALRSRAIFWHYPLYLAGRATRASAIRKGDWMLIEYFEDGRTELYNLSSDISESKNHADTAPEKARELHQELIAWRKATKAIEPREPNPRYNETPARRL